MSDLGVSESFRWVVPEFKVNDSPGKKVIIRGPALFSYEKYKGQGISRNARRYIENELVRSARTLKGKEIDVNHEVSLWEQNGQKGARPKGKGMVMFGEEEDGRVEYVAEVNDPVYRSKVLDTDKVRKGNMTEAEYKAKWGKGPIRGVSIDANFLKAKCTKPGCNKEFDNWNLFKEHMEKDHFQKNFEFEPHNLVFDRLSLVEPPEDVGVQGADFEVCETLNGMNGICEALFQEATKHDKPDPSALQKVQLTESPQNSPGQETQKIGEPCSPELKACVQDLISQGKDESSAWAICKAKIGETSETITDLSKLYEQLKARLPVQDQALWNKVIARLDEVALKANENDELLKRIKTLETEKAELQKSQSTQLTETQQATAKILTETQQKLEVTKRENQALQIELDNTQDKLKYYAQFKGHSTMVQPTPTKYPEYSEDPNRKRTR